MAYKYVTVAGAGAKDGAAWASAFGMAEFLHDLTDHVAAGDIYFVQAGTYTLTGAHDSNLKDGTAAAPITIIGVKAATVHEGDAVVVSDWGTWTVGHASDDCPRFVCGANTFIVGDNHKIFNCCFTITVAGGVTTGNYAIIYNCSFSNDSTTSNRYACSTGLTSRHAKGEYVSTSGYGLVPGNTNTVAYCYFHDSKYGVNGAHNLTLLFNVFDTMTNVGVLEGSLDGMVCVNNTFYSCPIAVSSTDSAYDFCINNIVDTATDGFLWTSAININFFAYNHGWTSGGSPTVTDMYDTVEETSCAHKDNWVTNDDPKITNKATGAFDLASDSPCIDAGMSLTLGVTAASEMNQGAWEATTAAASGSSPRFGDMTGGLK